MPGNFLLSMTSNAVRTGFSKGRRNWRYVGLGGLEARVYTYPTA